MRSIDVIALIAVWHLLWAVGITVEVCLGYSPSHMVATDTLRALLGGDNAGIPLACVLSLVGVIAILGSCQKKLTLKWQFILCIPQQVFLFLSSWDAIQCALRWKYADGYVPASPLFIPQDQVHTLLLTVAHLLALRRFKEYI